MNQQIFLTYCFTIFIASMIPGPSSMLALTQGARYGWTAGIFSGFGNIAASVIQGIVAYLIIYQIGGVSATFLHIIKYAGAAYIIYLGFTLFKVESFGTEPDVTGQVRSVNLIKYFSDGFAFAIFNPKALTFFAAMFPQFVGGNAMSTQLLITIFAPIAIIAFLCFILYVFAGRMIMSFMNKTRYMGKFFGGLIVFSGMVFLLS